MREETLVRSRDDLVVELDGRLVEIIALVTEGTLAALAGRAEALGISADLAVFSDEFARTILKGALDLSRKASVATLDLLLTELQSLDRGRMH